MNLPKHVAIIMDGNGRWGIKKGKSRNFGHKQGVKIVEKIINESIKKKIKFLTLYTLSTENWKRPALEINYLLKLLENYIDQELNSLIKKNIKIKIIGSTKIFSKKLKKNLKKVENITDKNYKIQVNIALNYGSRQEILNSVKRIKQKSLPINEKNISKFLYTSNIPDPDILIRTGNTRRLSNFLLWQLMYTEIFFEKKLWPDFTQSDFNRILKTYTNIKRKYGGL
tara:strand:+ start:2295 stop:2972 length:678 start_codon:yes stop_codon:yes gene_type:complete